MLELIEQQLKIYKKYVKLNSAGQVTIYLGKETMRLLWKEKFNKLITNYDMSFFHGIELDNTLCWFSAGEFDFGAVFYFQDY